MRPLNPAAIAHAKAYRPPPAEPRHSSSVILVRAPAPGAAGDPEVYLLRRQASMEFAAGMYVFPGGSIDESDRKPIDWIGPPAAVWAATFGCDEDLARALVVAAARELFEETGVLLVDGVPTPDVTDARVEVEQGRRSFADLLADLGVRLRADLLGPWAHWITPEFEPRRFDTRFFVAELPTGQAVGPLPGEADRGEWIPVDRALGAVASGAMRMMPPTRHTCRTLVGQRASTIVDVSRTRSFPTIAPRLVVHEGDYYLDRPGLDEFE